MLDTGQIALGGEALMSFRQGLAAATERDYDRALIYYNRVLDLRDDCYEVWYERGLVLEARGDYIEAIASYDRALSLKPNKLATCEIWHDRGNAFQYGLGDYDAALYCYERALQLNPQQDQVWQNRANALLYGQNLPVEALGCYNKAIAIDSDNYLAWRNRGNALLELRRFEDAVASYDRALSINPEDQISWHSRNMATEGGGLRDHLPTTKPAWVGVDSDEPTFVEGDSDSDIVFASQFTATHEFSKLPQGQPVLILEDDNGKREILLDRDRYQLGRDPQNEICLRSKFVSRHHAVLMRVHHSDGRFTYQIADGDLDGKPSTNGLLVNGQKCRTVDLQAEDVVVFGPRVKATYCLISKLV
jgi:tetratricopeptide (TPR) repeat protein